jgi:hypothetical protein
LLQLQLEQIVKTNWFSNRYLSNKKDYTILKIGYMIHILTTRDLPSDDQKIHRMVRYHRGKPTKRLHVHLLRAFEQHLSHLSRFASIQGDNPYDNAFMESCFSRLKAELLQDGTFETIEDAFTEIFEYLEMYYNTKRLHSSLDYQSQWPMQKSIIIV